ncbi:MAG: tyrosine-type recombinase/integrase [Bacteriovoracaceae bacterium]
MAITKKIGKNGKVSWQARIWKGKKAVASKTFERQLDAKKWIRDFDRSLGPETGVTVNELIEKFLDHTKTTKKYKTYYGYSKDFDKHFVPFFGDYVASSVTSESVRNYRKDLVRSGKSAKTINRLFGMFSSAFNFGIKLDLIEKNPIKGLGKLKVDRKKVEFWSVEECEVNLQKMSGWHYYDLVLTAILTGMRLSELSALQRKDIDFNRNQISINKSVEKGEQNRFKLGRTKTDNSNRVIPMSETTCRVLRSRSKGLQNNDLIFVSEQGGMIDVEHFTYRKFKPFQAKCKIDPQIKFHTLRDTYASNFVMNGGDIFTLQKLLGHSDIKHTQIYAHLSPSYLQEAANVFSINTLKLVEGGK